MRSQESQKEEFTANINSPPLQSYLETIGKEQKKRRKRGHRSYSYTWVVKDFQDLHADKTKKYIFSDSRLSTSADIDQDEGNTEDNYEKSDLSTKEKPTNQPQLEYKWRLLLYPHGNRKDVNTHISLYLAPAQSLYERQNCLETRIAKWRFELFRINEEQGSQIMGLTKLDCHQDVIQEKFTFASREPNWGIVKFCDLKNIFTNFNPQDLENPPMPTEKVNLAFRVHFLDEQSHFTTTDNSIDNIKIDTLLRLGPSLSNFFNNERLSDIEFTFSDTTEKLRASKIVLASRSDYFNRMFNGHWIESNTNQIHVKDVSHNVFRIIIYFLYTGHVDENLDFDVLKNVYYEADMREITELSRMASVLLVRLVNNTNWDEMLMLGWETGNSQLSEQGLMYVKSHWPELKNTEKMRELKKGVDAQFIKELESCGDGL
ncbi:16802_t:CDS:2 [Acaulospora colombiana]|uniref:16802_t:CDS:1 n=1 Tax=Acaulospora colombiana TaxID=27376 RepID=A0ACA9LRH9_9GLOM|nr:16802_t:CDS:2 [Acaulospora colombiana]